MLPEQLKSSYGKITHQQRQSELETLSYGRSIKSDLMIAKKRLPAEPHKSQSNFFSHLSGQILFFLREPKDSKA